MTFLSWVAVALLCSSPDAGVAAVGRACPAERSAIKVGAACANDTPAGCDFPDGSSCACETNRCYTPAGPVPGCKAVTRWVCRKDGCPIHYLNQSCATEGQSCHYDDGLCSTEAVCRKGS